MTLGDLATWVGAVATVGLLIGAVVTARYAIKTFHAQDEQLKQDMEQRRRAQAAGVYVEHVQKPQETTGAYRTIATATVHNTSRLPIYDLRVTWYKGTTPEEGTDRLKSLMPGGSHTFERKAHVRELLTVVGFYDATGIRWQRSSDGKLEDLKPS